MIGMILNTTVILVSLFGSYACDSLSHEVLKDDGKLSWAFAFRGCRNCFITTGVISTLCLFL